MPSGSSSDWLDIPLPFAGINSASAPVLLSEGEAVEAKNLVTFELGGVRSRAGWEAKADLAPFMSATDKPFAVNKWYDKLLVWYADETNFDTFQAPYYLRSDRNAHSGYDITSLVPKYLHVDASNPDLSVPTAGLTDPNVVQYAPWGYSVEFDEACWWTSAKPFSGTWRFGNAVEYTALWLCKWAGSNQAVSLINGISINNGSLNGACTASLGIDLTNMFLLLGTNAGNYVNYQVKEHDDANGTFKLYKPLGLGELDQGNLAGNYWARPIAQVTGSSADVQAVGQYAGYLFVGRPRLSSATQALHEGHYPCAIQWSKEPYNGDLWDEVNIAVLNTDPDDRVMGFGHAGDTFVVFTYKHIYQVNGYSTDTFSVDILEPNIGCLDGRSIMDAGNSTYFLSEYGLMRVTNRGVEDISQPRPGKGVRKRMMDEANLGRDDAHLFHQGSQVVSSVNRDHIVVSCQDMRSSRAENYAWAYHMQSGAWTRWGNEHIGQPFLFVYDMLHTTWAIHRNYITALDSMWFPEKETLLDLTNSKQDEYYDATVLSKYFIPIEWESRYERPAGGGEFQISNLRTEHTHQYVNPSSLATTMISWNLAFGVDERVKDSSYPAHPIKPRHETTYAPGRYYFEDNRSLDFPGTGGVFQVKITNDGNNTDPRADITRLYSVRMELSGSQPEVPKDPSY